MPRISQLPSLTTAANDDELPIVDVSASTTNKITRGDLLKAPLPTDSVTTAAIANNAVTANKVDSASLWDTAAINYVSTSQTTATQTYTNLATTQSVTVTIRQGGKLLVGISCADVQNNTQHSQAWISFDLSGANTVAAGSSTIEAKFQAYVNNGAGSVSATALLTGLSAGSTTVTMKFRASANTATFAGRLLWALPLV